MASIDAALRMNSRSTDASALPFAGATGEGATTLRGVVRSVVYRTDDGRYAVLRMTLGNGDEAVIVGGIGEPAG